MNPTKRGVDPFSGKGQAAKGATNQLKKQSTSGDAKDVKNTVGMKPGKAGYRKIKGSVSG